MCLGSEGFCWTHLAPVPYDHPLRPSDHGWKGRDVALRRLVHDTKIEETKLGWEVVVDLIGGAYPAWNVTNAFLECRKTCLPMTLLPSRKFRSLGVAPKLGLTSEPSKLNQRTLRLRAEHGAQLSDDSSLDELVIKILEPLLQLLTLSFQPLRLVELIKVLLAQCFRLELADSARHAYQINKPLLEAKAFLGIVVYFVAWPALLVDQGRNCLVIK